jgi:hypothetical protein
MKKNIKESIQFERYENVKSHFELGQLAFAIHDCVTSAFDRSDFDLNDTLKHLCGDLILVVKKDDSVASFSNVIFKSPSEVFNDESLSQEKGCYFAAAAVRESEKSTGLYSKMNEKRISTVVSNKLPLIFTRTQNPLVEVGISRQLKKFQEQGFIKDFSVSRKIVRGVYGQMLTSSEPQSKDEKINSAFKELDKMNGDAFILFFSIVY